MTIFGFLMQTFRVISSEIFRVDLLRIIKRWIFQVAPILPDGGDSALHSLLKVAFQEGANVLILRRIVSCRVPSAVYQLLNRYVRRDVDFAAEWLAVVVGGSNLVQHGVGWKGWLFDLRKMCWVGQVLKSGTAPACRQFLALEALVLPQSICELVEEQAALLLLAHKSVHLAVESVQALHIVQTLVRRL